MTNPIQSGEVVGVRLDAVPAQPDGVTPARPVRPHPYRQPFTWWLRRRGYVLYMVRELSAVPIAAWWVLFLVEVARMRQGAAGYRPLESSWFLAVSVLCLVAALWHTYTFLGLAGQIMRIPFGDRNVSPRAIVGAAFSGFAVLTAVVAGLLIWGGA